MRSDGWAANDESAHDYLWSDYPTDAAGPKLLRLFPDAEWCTLAYIPGWDFYHIGEDIGPAFCPLCRTRLEDNYGGQVLNSWWIDRVEPDVPCPVCPWTGPLGDWDISSSAAPAAFGIVINSRAGIEGGAAPRLAQELQVQLGGRWRHLFQHT